MILFGILLLLFAALMGLAAKAALLEDHDYTLFDEDLEE